MSNSDLLSYVGAVTGVVGAITGIAGSAMGYFGLQKTGEIKSLELRLELMKAAAEVFQKVDNLSDLLVRAKNSRDAIAAATGTYHSGARERWTRQLAADEESLESINESFDELNVDYSESKMRELEKAIGELYGLRTILDGISERYLGSIAEDDRNRELLRSQAHARATS